MRWLAQPVCRVFGSKPPRILVESPLSGHEPFQADRGMATQIDTVSFIRHEVSTMSTRSGMSLVLSIVIGISYWAAFELFDKLGGINQLSPWIAAWFPNLIFGLSGFWLLLRVRT